MTDRRIRLQTHREDAQSFQDRLLAAFHVSAGVPVHYPDGALYEALVALDADPNTSAPAAARILLGAPESGAPPISHVAVWPSVITQAAVLRVWARSQVAAVGWVPIRTISLAGDGSDNETQIGVGARDVFVQVVSGADAGHPLTLAVAAC